MENLTELIEHTENAEYETNLEFELDILPSFCEAIGVDEDFLFYQTNIGEGLRPDGLIQINFNRAPWLVVEVKKSNAPHIIHQAQDQVRRYLEFTNADYAVIIGNGYISVTEPDGELFVEANPNDIEAIEEIESILTPPDYLLAPTEAEDVRRETSGEEVSFDNYSINLDDLETALEAVDEAETNHEKGDTFEELANLLFEAIPFLEVRDKNLETNTGEIDLVVEYQGTNEPTIFDNFCRFILVECKNWSNSVGVSKLEISRGRWTKQEST
ncbi:MAG: restriction endonuclease [Halobacteriales archaeon]|nr:restriction endonuclease [Halobacteriales archaeon]